MVKRNFFSCKTQWYQLFHGTSCGFWRVKLWCQGGEHSAVPFVTAKGVSTHHTKSHSVYTQVCCKESRGHRLQGNGESYYRILITISCVLSEHVLFAKYYKFCLHKLLLFIWWFTGTAAFYSPVRRCSKYCHPGLTAEEAKSYRG